MPLTISDEVLKAAGLTEEQARIEIACRLFDAGKLTMTHASRLAGLSRDEFTGELMDRNMPVHRIDEEYWRQELESLKKLGMTL
jgi:predicted HTH domain antitoxin